MKYKIDQLNALSNQITAKETELVNASKKAVEMYTESSTPPKE